MPSSLELFGRVGLFEVCGGEGFSGFGPFAGLPDDGTKNTGGGACSGLTGFGTWATPFCLNSSRTGTEPDGTLKTKSIHFSLAFSSKSVRVTFITSLKRFICNWSGAIKYPTG